MARLDTAGAEGKSIGTVSTAGYYALDGFGVPAATPPTPDATVVRSGAVAYRCLGTAADTSAIVVFLGVSLGGRTYRGRVWIYFTVVPTSTINIVAMTSGGTAAANVKLTPSATAQLWNTASTPAQVGSDSDPLAVNTWHRIELAVKNGVVSADDAMECRVNGVVIGSAIAASSVAVLPNDLRAGWLNSAPGVTTEMYIDDIAVNDDTGTYEKSWPPPDAHVLINLPQRVITNTGSNWKSSKGASSAEADIIDALNNTPPIGKAHTTTDTVNSQVYNAVNPAAGTPHDLTVECMSFGRIGVPGNVFSDTLSGTYLAIGSATANQRRSQRFYLQPTVAYTTLHIRKVGTPADNFELAIQADSSTNPDGTDLSLVSVAGADIGTSGAWVTFTPQDQPLTVGTPYHYVLRRSGAVDAANYYEVQTSTLDYYDGGTNVYGGSWGAIDRTACLAFRAYSSVGNAIINTVYASAATGEDAAGTKQGTLAMTGPTLPTLTISAFGQTSDAGIYPGNGWSWKNTELATNVIVPSMLTTPRITLAKVNSSANPALCCSLFAMIEYTDPPAGWALYDKTSDGTDWWVKYAAHDTTFTQADGTDVPVTSGNWAITADPLSDTDPPTTIAAISDSDLRTLYTPA